MNFQERIDVRKSLESEIYTITKKNSRILACIQPILPPRKGSRQYHWAVIRRSSDNHPLFLIRRQIGYKNSQDGEAHEICMIKKTGTNSAHESKSNESYVCDNTEKLHIIVKLIPVKKEAMDNMDNLFDYHPWKEIWYTSFASDITFKQISPHFPFYYSGFTCESPATIDMFKNINIRRRIKNKTITTDIMTQIVDIGAKINELDYSSDVHDKLMIGYDLLKNRIKNINSGDYGQGVEMLLIEQCEEDFGRHLDSLQKISYNEVLMISFQILQALLVLHDTTNIIHFDLHPHNIVIKKQYTHSTNGNVSKRVFNEYEVYDKTYYVPQHEYNILIIDFGRSEKLEFMTVDEMAVKASRDYAFLINESKSRDYYNRVHKNLQKDVRFFREYFKSFDVMRIFTELYHTLYDVADRRSLDFLKSIAKDAKTDFVSNFATLKYSRSKKHTYIGHPETLLNKYFYENNIFTENLGEIKPKQWEYGTKYSLTKNIQRSAKKGMEMIIKKHKHKTKRKYVR